MYCVAQPCSVIRVNKPMENDSSHRVRGRLRRDASLVFVFCSFFLFLTEIKSVGAQCLRLTRLTSYTHTATTTGSKHKAKRLASGRQGDDSLCFTWLLFTFRHGHGRCWTSSGICDILIIVHHCPLSDVTCNACGYSKIWQIPKDLICHGMSSYVAVKQTSVWQNSTYKNIKLQL